LIFRFYSQTRKFIEEINYELLCFEFWSKNEEKMNQKILSYFNSIQNYEKKQEKEEYFLYAFLKISELFFNTKIALFF